MSQRRHHCLWKAQYLCSRRQHESSSSLPQHISPPCLSCQRRVHRVSLRMLTATDAPTSPAHTEISQITDWRAGIGWSNERGEGADQVGGEGRASKKLTTETLVHIDMRGRTHDCTCVMDSVCASHASTSAVGRLLGVGCIMDAIRSARPFDTPGSGGACPLRSRTNSSPCAANLLFEPSSAPRAVICISSRHSVSSGAGASRGSDR